MRHCTYAHNNISQEEYVKCDQVNYSYIILKKWRECEFERQSQELSSKLKLKKTAKRISIKQICCKTHTGNRCNFCAEQRHWINKTCERANE